MTDYLCALLRPSAALLVFSLIVLGTLSHTCILVNLSANLTLVLHAFLVYYHRHRRPLGLQVFGHLQRWVHSTHVQCPRLDQARNSHSSHYSRINHSNVRSPFPVAFRIVFGNDSFILPFLPESALVISHDLPPSPLGSFFQSSSCLHFHAWRTTGRLPISSFYSLYWRSLFVSSYHGNDSHIAPSLSLPKIMPPKSNQ